MPVSTTTKVALVDEDGNLLYSFYSSNNGSPLDTTIKAIKDIYTKLSPKAKIVQSCSTGYGEALIKQHLCLMKVKLKLCPISMLLHSLTLRLTVL